ncbi:MAG: type II secretion system protein, partial [Gammaproteobacteria bacterium]|nr:type II secretion system protein [Gammaproteobacteria bacterium]
MSNKRRMRNAAGMTLVEMLVALVILSLGMYANLRMLTESIASLNTAGQQQRAASAIRDLA